jgi:hypothetical protein
MSKNYFLKKSNLGSKILFLGVLSILSPLNIILATYFSIPEIATSARGQTSAEPRGPKKSDRPRKAPSANGNRRGCSDSEQLESNSVLTLLAPIFGKSVSTYPTFFWFIPNEQANKKEYNIEFSIYEYDAETGDKKGTYIQRISKKSSPGIMEVSLDKQNPGLVAGKEYLWQVTLECDINDSSNTIIAKAVIEIVPTPTNLTIQLSRTQNYLDRAKLYTQEKLWYEALNEIPENERSREYVKILEELRDSEKQESIKASNDKKLQKTFEKQVIYLQKLIDYKNKK